jgi:hypothetical protein
VENKHKKKWSIEDENFLKENYSNNGVKYCAEKLKRSKPSIVGKCILMGLRKNKDTSIFNSEELLKKYIKESDNKTEVMFKFGIINKGANYKTLNKYIERYNIDISHLEKKTYKMFIKNKIPLEQILIKNSLYKSSTLKERLYKEGLKKRECELCGQGEIWNEKKMSLILDHINGIHNDNRLENLRIVCPNCNATLDTHCGKNNKRESKTKIRKQGINGRKMLKNEKIKQEITLVLNSNIDFSIFGWSGKVAKLIGILPQKVNGWMRNNIPEFYEQKCYKKNFNKYFCSCCGNQIEKNKTGICGSCNRKKTQKLPDVEQLKSELEIYSTTELIKKYKVNRTTLYNYCKRHNIN